MGPIAPAVTGLRATAVKGTYSPGEPVTLTVTAESSEPVELTVEVNFWRGLELIERQQTGWKLSAGHNEIKLDYQPGPENPAGYGVDVALAAGSSGKPFLRCQSAFDVLRSWTVSPRYGFVCDFSPERSDIPETVETLNRFHVNGLQFYDWQYRHDTLVAPQQEYSDPLGRRLSLKTVKSFIEAAHTHGMAAMPYLAIYAASAAFWKSHPEWALYDQGHQPIPFGEDFLGLMNPVPGGGWSSHLLAECQNVLEKLPFDGLHIDQYGDPKTGFDSRGQPVDLPQAFADFVAAAAAQQPGAAVLFNLVGNWPAEALAASPTAFTYIEIWPPQTTYTDVAEVVRSARQLSGQKPVVIALYLPASRQINNRLADAVILSAGGSRIELGENGRLLADPYFPKHQAVPPRLAEVLRLQTELAIRYADWIGPWLPESPLPPHELQQGVAAFFRGTAGGYSLSLVNLDAGRTLHWNEEHGVPGILKDLPLEIQLDRPVRKVWLVSPDTGSLDPYPLDYEFARDRLILNVPSLEIWDVLLIETR